MRQIDINCDMGESFGAYKIGNDEEMIKYISSANIACGFHAGDPLVMRDTVNLAKLHNVAIGAHPGFPDLIGFGRRIIGASPDEIENYVLYQIGALKVFVEAQGLELQHVKLHGAINGMAAEDENVMTAVAKAVRKADPSLICLVLAGSKGDRMGRIARESGLRIALEAYPDRAYLPTGLVAPRKQPGAVIKDPDEIVERATRMASEGKVEAIDGSSIDLKANSLCFHGDNPANVQTLQKIRQRLAKLGIEISPMGTFV
jgi:5-oxoprolinase (ATP-hydrolysing) subunit A